MRPPARPLKAAVAGSRNDWLATGLSLQSPAYTARTVEDPELRFTPGGQWWPASGWPAPPLL
jgi:hypothetical protein